MNDNACYVDFCGLEIHYSFTYPETKAFFSDFLGDCTDTAAVNDICVTRKDIKENHWLFKGAEKSEAIMEFESLMLATGNELLLHRRALYHGAALLWKGLAWILTAPSGTGKTTQLRHWKVLLNSEAKVINGDKPLLVMKEDGAILACSSPWRGKEKHGIRGLCAPLGGIILLEQGDRNVITRLAAADAVVPLFTEFISCPENEEQIRCQAKMLDQILRKLPVWKLVNLGDRESAVLTLLTLKRYLEETNG